jgi:hypothetical protein
LPKKHLDLNKDERNFLNASKYMPNHAHLHHKINSKIRNKNNYNDQKPDFGNKLLKFNISFIFLSIYSEIVPKKY